MRGVSSHTHVSQSSSRTTHFSPSSSDSLLPPTRVLMSFIPPMTSGDELNALFRHFGTVLEVRLVPVVRGLLAARVPFSEKCDAERAVRTLQRKWKLRSGCDPIFATLQQFPVTWTGRLFVSPNSVASGMGLTTQGLATPWCACLHVYVSSRVPLTGAIVCLSFKNFFVVCALMKSHGRCRFF